MIYEFVDPIITAWAAKPTLQIYTTNRDEEVRSVDLVGSNGRKCRLWIDAPDQSGTFRVQVWDYENRREITTATVADPARCLEQGYAIAMRWLG
jgi:hypothetical protein